jgi:putative CocE/NonD family hydrolase
MTKGSDDGEEVSQMEEFFMEMLRQLQRDYDALDLPVVSEEGKMHEFMLPMPDGVKLQTFLFYGGSGGGEAAGTDCRPVILQRSPYAHSMDSYRVHGENLARRGFIYIVQFCRGTGGSEGEWDPNVNERADGLATLNWLQEQSWVKNIGYWGDSYLALTGWCMADAVPEKVKGMYLGVYGTDRFTSAYQKGLFRHDVLTSWAMENAGFSVEADYMDSCRFRPHYRVDEALWGKEIPWYRRWITATKEDDPYWQEGFWKLLREIPEKVKIPLYVTEGWYDHHLGSALKSYANLSGETLEKSTLSIGSWNHFCMNCLEWSSPEHLENSEVASMVKWFTTLLVKEQTPKRSARIYLIGADRWEELPSWPVPVKETKRFYLAAEEHPECAHAYVLHGSEGAALTQTGYLYRPDDPAPSHGAESMLKSMDQVGSMYQPEPGFRPDVITFVSETLKEEMLIAGQIRVHLTVASDCEDTAFTAKVMEIKADGRAVNIRSSITTIEADLPCKTAGYVPGERTRVCVDMWDIAWQVSAGSRIRVDISSSDFPQYAVHANYPGVWSKQEKTRDAHQTIFCGFGQESFIEFPVAEL